MKPKISICIPTFNRADLLEKALYSVSKQTVKPYEIIVVDNASTDNTKEVVRKFKRFGVKYFRNKKNVGMANNWNVCIQKSTGDYLTLLHNDDLIAPNWYELMSQAVQANPKVKFFMSSLLIIDEQEHVQHVYHTFPTSRLISKNDTIKAFWTHLLPGFAPTAANLYHRSIFKKIGLFEERYKTEADVISSVNVLQFFDVFYIKEAIFAYRSHAKQGFDLVENKKTLQVELERKKNHYAILLELYSLLFHSDQKHRFFIVYPVFMTLAPISLFLIKGEISKVLAHFKLAKEYFTDLFTYPYDFFLFWYILVLFIKRLTLDKFFLIWKKKEYSWLSHGSLSS